MSATINLSIDGKPVTAEKGLTILEAAGRNLVAIPHLCDYPGLAPFGACRMCVVEVEGMRGYPPACSTPVMEGMVVRTQTPGVQSLRRETLQLMLSEHPSNCLFCEEALACGAYMATTRKSEAVTGCRSCPKDGQCELQEVVKQTGLEQVGLPVHYRNLPVEKFDPFYDRDYNLCILCGRCVRACQDVRLADVLTFKQRGPSTVIGPSFERSHLEAGCEFCGDCVAACPTGALSEKTLKWAGRWEKEVDTTCMLCSLGCSLRLLVQGDEVMGSLPARQGELCVKGRFSAYELLNNPDRLRYPSDKNQPVSWDKAIELAAEKLSTCQPEQFGMLVSPDCTNEDLYIAHKFARQVMGSNRVYRRPTTFYATEDGANSNIARVSGRLEDLRDAATILSIGLDGRFGWSVVGLEIKQAVKRGARLFTVLAREPHLSPYAEAWLALDGDAVAAALETLAQPEAVRTQIANPDLDRLAEALSAAASVVIIAGPEYLQDPDGRQVYEAIGALASRMGARVLWLAPQANLFGAMQIERLFESQPFPISTEIERRDEGLFSRENTHGAEALQVLYLIGETPAPEDPHADFVIYQNFAAFDGKPYPDLSLPAAAFSEVDGAITNLEGYDRLVHKAVDPPGEALPDWVILGRIAQKMGFPGFDYPDVTAIRQEIEAMQAAGRINSSVHPSSTLPSLSGGKRKPDALLPSAASGGHLNQDSYRGFPLTTWVDGLRSLD